MALSSQLGAYRQSYQSSHDLAIQVSGQLSDEQFNWKPSATSWSVGECIEHLNIVAEKYLPLFESASSADHPNGNGPFRYGLISRKFINSVSPDSRRLPTADAMKPPAGTADRSALNKKQTLEAFDSLTQRYLVVIDNCEGLDIAAIKIRSPFLKLLRLPLGAFLEALGQHAIRHVHQAKRVTEASGFPT